MPKKRYQQALNNRQLQHDAMQMHVVEQLESLKERLTQAGEVPHRSIGARLASLVARKNPRQENVKGLYIWGSVGRGKTYLMDIFYDCLPLERKLRLHFHRFMHEVHEYLNRVHDAQAPLTLVAKSFKRRADIICLDELFVSDIGDAMILAGLLEACLTDAITLVITSNCRPDDLYKNGLQRQKFIPAIRLLKQHTEVVELAGHRDHRLEFLEHANIYHHPLGEEADQIMLNNFMRVSPEPGEENQSLSIENRRIQTVRCADSAVWFTFNDLCAGPRSAADYIEIARCFNSVLISNIPCLTHQDDLARRFITAIDEFYDRNVKVIISAQLPVQDLYKGDKLAFEFQRTVSRLLEMRSHDYLARAHKSL